MQKELELQKEFLKEDKDESVEIVDGKKVRYNFSFEARLLQTTEENKKYYAEIIHTLKSYGVKTSRSWKQDRIYLGRTTYGVLLFKGKRLCLALALDPKRYEDTKYKGIDLSGIKRFEDTPMLIKLTSDRKMKYCGELLEILFKENGINPAVNPQITELCLSFETTEELLKRGLVKPVLSKTIMNAVVTETEALEEEAPVFDSREAKTEEIPAVSKKKQTYPRKEKKAVQKEVINLKKLQGLSEEVITLNVLKGKKLVSRNTGYVKVLGVGALTKKICIKLQGCSAKALGKIQAAGAVFEKEL